MPSAYTVGNLWSGFETSAVPTYATNYTSYDGFDLIWSQQALASQMQNAQTQMQTIENNDNLSDTEKMFDMQMTMNTWSSIANLRTNVLKSVSDTLKSIGRNIS